MPSTLTAFSRPHLIVNLTRLKHNYQVLQKLSRGEMGAVVKADAYGLGLIPVSRCLWSAGCRTFFVAFCIEGQALREALPDAEIFVFAPDLSHEAELLFEHRLTPCINSRRDLLQLAERAAAANVKAPVALHFDTGINRLGIRWEECAKLTNDSSMNSLEVNLVMSHLACSDEPDHELNKRQLDRFLEVTRGFPEVRMSLANSGGVFMDQRYHFDLARPGIALYGHDPHYPLGQRRVLPVASLQSSLAQVKPLQPGDSVGYGATVAVEQPSIMAVAFGGYADGVMRSLATPRANGSCPVLVNGHEAQMLGRVSMDLCTLQIDPEGTSKVQAGDPVEFFGDDLPLERLAEHAGTIPYEVLTQINSRVPRLYVE